MIALAQFEQVGHAAVELIQVRVVPGNFRLIEYHDVGDGFVLEVENGRCQPRQLAVGQGQFAPLKQFNDIFHLIQNQIDLLFDPLQGYRLGDDETDDIDAGRKIPGHNGILVGDLQRDTLLNFQRIGVTVFRDMNGAEHFGKARHPVAKRENELIGAVDENQ